MTTVGETCDFEALSYLIVIFQIMVPMVVGCSAVFLIPNVLQTEQLIDWENEGRYEEIRVQVDTSEHCSGLFSRKLMSVHCRMRDTFTSCFGLCWIPLTPFYPTLVGWIPEKMRTVEEPGMVKICKGCLFDGRSYLEKKTPFIVITLCGLAAPLLAALTTFADLAIGEMEETARGRARVEEIRAMTDADVVLKKSLGNETVEKVIARRDAEALLRKTHIQCQTMKIEAEKKVNVEVKSFKADLAVAEIKAAAMIARVEAEADGAEALREKRRHELGWKKLKVLETIAGNKSRKFITGEKGEAILSAPVPRM